MNRSTLLFYILSTLIFLYVFTTTCYKLNKSYIELFQNVQNNGNLNYTIIMFMTGGICDEAHNCIKTLQNINLQDKIKVYTLDKQADTCIQNLNIKTKFNDVKLDLSSNFGEKEFYKMMYEKLNAIEDCLKNTNNIVVYTDTDIVFFRSIEPDISKFSNSNYDIMFQCDNSDFNTDCKVFCAGFIFLKPTQNTFNCLKRAKEIMKRDMDNKKARTEKGGADQRALNLAIEELNINVGTLDLKDYANGARYFKSKDVNSAINDVYTNYTPIMLHNNYIKGGENKRKRFQNNDLWYINDSQYIEHFKQNNKHYFIHIPKCAGVSLKNILNTNNLNIEYVFHDYPEVHNNEIIVLRDPIDRFISAFYYLVKNKNDNLLNFDIIDTPNKLAESLYTRDYNYYYAKKIFQDVTDKKQKNQMPYHSILNNKIDTNWVFAPQYLYFNNPKYVLHFENLEEDFNRCLKDIGYNKTIKLPNKNTTHNKNTYLSPISLKFIRNYYKKDFDLINSKNTFNY